MKQRVISLMLTVAMGLLYLQDVEAVPQTVPMPEQTAARRVQRLQAQSRTRKISVVRKGN